MLASGQDGESQLGSLAVAADSGLTRVLHRQQDGPLTRALGPGTGLCFPGHRVSGCGRSAPHASSSSGCKHGASVAWPLLWASQSGIGLRGAELLKSESWQGRGKSFWKAKWASLCSLLRRGRKAIAGVKSAGDP